MYIPYFVQGQTATAIWSGNFLVLYRDLGRQLVRQKDNFYFFWFVLFWFDAIVVYITPTKL